MPESYASRVEALRRDFDGEFVLPPPQTEVAQEKFLFFDVVDNPYAIRMTELFILLTHATITSVANSVSGLIGLVGLRGELVAVYSLQELLGYGRETDPERFLLIGSEFSNVAFSVSDVETYHSISPNNIAAFADAHSRPYIKEILSFEEQIRHVISFSALVRSVRRNM